MRPIDADQLKQAIDKLLMPGKDVTFETYIDALVCAAIDDAPTVDAEPVRHERWEISLNGEPFCSGCCMGHRLTGRIQKYCPNCGAKMDEPQTIKTIEQEEKQCTP